MSPLANSAASGRQSSWLPALRLRCMAAANKGGGRHGAKQGKHETDGQWIYGKICEDSHSTHVRGAHRCCTRAPMNHT